MAIGFNDIDRATLAVIAKEQRHQTFLLQATLTNLEYIMTTLDDFITSMTAKMTAEATEIAGLKTFIQGLFAQIAAAVPAITPEQQTALDAIQTAADSNAAGITAAMLNTSPPNTAS